MVIFDQFQAHTTTPVGRYIHPLSDQQPPRGKGNNAPQKTSRPHRQNAHGRHRLGSLRAHRGGPYGLTGRRRTRHNGRRRGGRARGRSVLYRG
ncbi:hypothetical protein GCM10010341_79620 [Streptomyces noursei]|nr:hypothetical protein GCM10010341_79620 [Streptomyces noursei]